MAASQHHRLAVLAAAAAIVAASGSIPAVGDNVGVFYCGSTAGAQRFSLGAAHIIANGTEGSNPPLVFDIAGPSNASGTPIHIWGSYSPVHPSQTWSVSASAVTSLYNDMCLAVTELSVSAPLVIERCNASAPTQRLTYNAANGTFSLSAAPGLCLQAANTSLSCQQPPLSALPFCNASLPVAARVADMVSRMTPAERAAALDSSVPAIGRLGLPAMPSGEGLHGLVTGCFYGNGTGCPTGFPCPMALGATFDAGLWGDVGAAIGVEARAFANAGRGGLWLFAPNLNPARDPRWGRNQEVRRGTLASGMDVYQRVCSERGFLWSAFLLFYPAHWLCVIVCACVYAPSVVLCACMRLMCPGVHACLWLQVPSEDPIVAAQYGVAFIQGMQGIATGNETHLLAAATAKHFMAYGEGDTAY